MSVGAMDIWNLDYSWHQQRKIIESDIWWFSRLYQYEGKSKSLEPKFPTKDTWDPQTLGLFLEY